MIYKKYVSENQFYVRLSTTETINFSITRGNYLARVVNFGYTIDWSACYVGNLHDRYSLAVF